MESPFERLRISIEREEVTITLEGEEESISFGGVAPLDTAELPGQFYKLSPAERPEEYVITLEFDRSEAEELEGPSLARLDASMKNVRLKLHDDGYVLEGELTSWIGYTDAVVSTSG